MSPMIVHLVHSMLRWVSQAYIHVPDGRHAWKSQMVVYFPTWTCRLGVSDEHSCFTRKSLVNIHVLDGCAIYMSTFPMEFNMRDPKSRRHPTGGLNPKMDDPNGYPHLKRGEGCDSIL